MSIDSTLINEYTKEALSIPADRLSQAYLQVREDWLVGKENAHIKERVFLAVIGKRSEVYKKIGSMLLMPNELPGISMSEDRYTSKPGGGLETISVNFTQEQIGGLISEAKTNKEQAIDMFKMYELEPARAKAVERYKVLDEKSLELHREVHAGNLDKKEEYFKVLGDKGLVENSIVNINHLIKKHEEKKAEFAAEKKQEVKPVVPARPAKDAVARLKTLTEAAYSHKVVDTLTGSATLFTKPQDSKVEKTVVAQGMDKFNLKDVMKIIAKDKHQCAVARKPEGIHFTGKDAIEVAAKAQTLCEKKPSFKLNLKNCDKSLAVVHLSKAIEKGLNITKCTFTDKGKTQEIDVKEIALLKKAATKEVPEASKTRRPGR